MVDLSKNATLPLMLCLALVLCGQVHSLKQKFCGAKLVKTLQNMCEFYPEFSKRNKDFKIQPNDFAVSPKDWPIIHHSELDQIVTAGRMKYAPYWFKHFPSGVGENDVEVFDQDRFQQWKRQSGVANECCLQPCTMEYLIRNYCGSN